MTGPERQGITGPMTAMDVAGRSARVRRSLAGRCDALLVTKPANVRWLTGFTGSNGAVAVTPDGLLLATDGRYADQVAQQLDEAGVEAEVVIERDVIAALIGRMSGLDTVGLESHHITWDQQQNVVEQLGDTRQVEPIDRLIEELRQVKDTGELARLGRAAAIADRALAEVMADLPVGVTEQAIARRLESVMADLGAGGPSFPTIVASGPLSARPHAVPSGRSPERGDLLVIDMGASVDGYGSDMTRTFVVGGFDAETGALYEAVEEAQKAGLATVRAGTSTSEVDQACRQVLAGRGLEELFVHGTGHGIGLEIHENPFLGKAAASTLATGQVVTVEPGVYRPGLGGVRIEDSVVVEDDGCRPITHSPKEPVIAIGR